MGKILQLSCPSCSEEWELRIGHGIAHATLENVLNAFPPKIQAKILSDTASETYPHFDFQYRPAICIACGKPIAAAEIKLLTAGTAYTAPCDDCGGAVFLPEENTDIICPNCSKGPLTLRSIGFWD